MAPDRAIRVVRRDPWKNTKPPDLSVRICKSAHQVDWSSVTHTDCGLLNLGASCYMNATIQALLHIPAFLDLLTTVSNSHISRSGSCVCVLCTFNATYKKMTEFKSILSHKGLAAKMNVINSKMSVAKEEDALEYLLSIFHTIVSEEIQQLPKNITPSYCAQQTTGIDCLFGFWAKTTNVCKGCAASTSIYSSHRNILIPTAGNSVQKGIDSIISGTETVQEFKCSTCCLEPTDIKQCSKSWEFYTYPNILIVAVDRFINSVNDSKDMTPVVMQRKISVGTKRYSLRSSIIHHGPFKSSGHYTCTTICPNGTSTDFNDQQVVPHSNGTRTLKTLNGVYIIFYELENMVQLLKRSRPPTPTKLSPAMKKWRSPMEKTLQGGALQHLSPKKRKQQGKSYSILKPRALDMIPVDKNVETLHQTTNFRLPLPLTVKDEEAALDKLIVKPKAGAPDVMAQPLQTTHDALYHTPRNDRLVKLRNTQQRAPAHLGSCGLKTNMPSTEDTGFPTLQLGLNNDTSTGVVRPPIKPVIILRSQRSQPKETLSQSSHEYTLLNDEGSQDSVVRPPIKPVRIHRSQRTEPKETLSQSSHEYTLLNDEGSQDSVVRPPIKPVRILKSQRTEPKETLSQSSHEYTLLKDEGSQDSVVRPPIKPVRILKSQRLEPKETLSQSSHEYTLLKDEGSQDSVVRPPIKPVRILKSQRTEPKETLSQYSHEYTLLNDEGSQDTDSDGSEGAEQCPTVPSPTGCVERSEKSYYIEEDIALSDSDVPGAQLPNPIVEKNVVRDLKRWLYCHQQSVQGNKTVLVARILECMKSAKPHPVRKEVDNGVWIQKKLDRLRMAYTKQCSQSNFPESGFGTFPSIEIPESFNFKGVFHYLIESRPRLQCSSSSSDDSANDTQEVPEVPIKDPFTDPKCKEMLRMKLLRRGLQYVKSGWIRGLQDCSDGRYYYVKAHVRASMEPQAYWVYITISKITGGVCQVTCGYPCPAVANGRCSHVSAALLQIVAHIHLNGYSSITCTSKPQEWGKGTLKRNPSVIADRQYDSFKINVKRRAHFDPRPTDAKGCLSRQQINDFLSALQYKEEPCYWQIHLSITYEDFECCPEDLEILENRRKFYYESLAELYKAELTPNQHYEGPFQFPGTEGQSNSVIWRTMRALNCTASCCKQICKMTSDKSVKKFLRRHLWGLDPFTSKACKYGIRHEDKARAAYIEKKTEEDDTVEVFTTGLHVHTEYLGLACSLDGKVTSGNSPPCNLEIKCPYKLRNDDPNTFEKVLTKKQKDNFCLTRNERGELELKKNHNYYYQIQMGMGLTECRYCDFFLWSKLGSILIKVPFDEQLWEEIRERMLLFHWERLVPDYFLMKTPRNLSPVTL